MLEPHYLLSDFLCEWALVGTRWWSSKRGLSCCEEANLLTTGTLHTNVPADLDTLAQQARLVVWKVALQLAWRLHGRLCQSLPATRKMLHVKQHTCVPLRPGTLSVRGVWYFRGATDFVEKLLRPILH